MNTFLVITMLSYWSTAATVSVEPMENMLQCQQAKLAYQHHLQLKDNNKDRASDVEMHCIEVKDASVVEVK